MAADLYMTMINGEVEGPWDLRQLINMSQINRETLVCPEFELGDWRPLGEELARHPQAEFLWRMRENGEKLLLQNRALRRRNQELSDERDAESARLNQKIAELENERKSARAVEKQALDDAQAIRQEAAALREKVGAEIDTLDALRKEADEARAKYEGSRFEIERFRAEARVALDRLRDEEAKVKAAEGEITLLRGEAAKLDREAARLRIETRDRERHLDRLSGEGTDYKERVERAEAQVRSIREHWQSSEKALLEEKELLARQLESARARLLEREAGAGSARSTLEAAETRAAEAEARLRTLQTNWRLSDQQFSQEQERLKAAVETERGLRTQAEEALLQTREAVRKLKQDLLEKDGVNYTKSAELETEVRRLQSQLLQKSSRIEMLETRLRDAGRPVAPLHEPPRLSGTAVEAYAQRPQPPAPPKFPPAQATAGGGASAAPAPEDSAVDRDSEPPSPEEQTVRTLPPLLKDELPLPQMPSAPVKGMHKELWLIGALLSASLLLWGARMMKKPKPQPEPAQRQDAAIQPGKSAARPVRSRRPAMPRPESSEIGEAPKAFPGFVSSDPAPLP